MSTVAEMKKKIMKEHPEVQDFRMHPQTFQPQVKIDSTWRTMYSVKNKR